MALALGVTPRMRLLLLVLLGACATPSYRVEVRAPAPPATRTSCQFEGPWSGSVRVQGQAVFRAYEVPAVAELNGQRLQGHLEKGGWHVFGEADLSQDAVLHITQPTWMNEGVALSGGAAVRVLESAPGQVRAAPHLTARPFPEGIASSVHEFTCEELSLARHPSTAEADWQALSLPADGEERVQAAQTPLSLSVRAGYPPFVTFEPEDYPRRYRIVGRTEVDGVSHLRVVGDAGVLVVGWTPSAALSSPVLAGGGLGVAGVFGALVGGLAESREECVAGESLEVYAMIAGNQVSFGRLEEGTSFVAVARLADGWMQIAPLAASSGLFLAQGAELRTRPFSEPTCTQVPVPSLADVLSADQVPAETLNFELEVQNVTGLSGVSGGDHCSLELSRMPGGIAGNLDGHEMLLSSCRAVLTCGVHVLFGAQTTNGFFDCRRENGHYSGRDEHTSDQVGSDPAFSLSQNGRVTAEDTASPAAPAYRLEAQIIP